MVSDGQRIYLTGASTIRAFEPKRDHGKGSKGKGAQGKQG